MPVRTRLLYAVSTPDANWAPCSGPSIAGSEAVGMLRAETPGCGRGAMSQAAATAGRRASDQAVAGAVEDTLGLATVSASSPIGGVSALELAQASSARVVLFSRSAPPAIRCCRWRSIPVPGQADTRGT